MQLSIIIVNWNSVDYLRPCLRSIFSETSGIDFEVIVVDNASYDGSAEMLRNEFPAVIFIQSDANLGFSRANNLGYSRSSGMTLLFLNPDTEVLGGAITKMLAAMDMLSRAGVLGCRLLNTDLSLQTSAIQAFPTICNQLLDADYLRRIFPRWSIWGIRPLYDRPATPAQVETISGACMMVKRAAFENVGGFSEAYFMYSEDLDLCYKIRRAGDEICYVDGASIIHHGGTSSLHQKDSNFDNILQKESLTKFFTLTRGSVYAAFFRVVTAGTAFIRLLMLGCAWPLAAIIRKRLNLRTSFNKWTKILRWSIGLEGWAGTADR